ncbi:hypothetical protein, partial [Clostridium perfringens]|uniref:hypothetical protein n=1 Tax=Clostridium perfringens TaxID=1502 RepID=UPI0037552A2B
DTEGKPYAEMPKTSDEDIAAAKSNVKFALITGSKDFRHGNVLDIYQSGFQPDGFRARLFDVPGMGHEVCSGATLEQALGFLR